MPAERVVNEMIVRLEAEEYEMHVGMTKDILDKTKASTQEALRYVNGITG